ncbi:MAG: hypothetical protein KJ607_10220, partial [Bacteroidetes bacterium]|nr:hypothetical protein [Bacteroidota bacterium]
MLKIAGDESGDLYVCGSFISIGGQARNRIAKLNADGTADAAWNPNAGNSVYDIVFHGDMIYVGGSFTTMGGQPRNRLAALNRDGSVAGWNPDMDNTVMEMKKISDNDMLVGGSFMAVNGYTSPKLANFKLPIFQAKKILFSDIQTTQTGISWTNGTENNRCVFVKEANSGTAAPVDNTTYSASAVFGDGDQIGGTGWYCVYNGNGSNVTVTGLAADKIYRAMVCEYRYAPGFEEYCTDASVGNPRNVSTFDLPGSGKCLDFAGDNDYVDLADIKMGGDFTIEAWIYCNDPTTDFKPIISKHTVDGAIDALSEFDFQVNNNGSVNFFMGNGVGYGISLDGHNDAAVQDILAMTWHHVAVTVSGTTGTLYIDGIQHDQDNFAGGLRQSGDLQVQIGRYNNGAPMFWNGRLDEIRIWNTALTLSQIRDYMCMSVPPAHPAFADLIAYYQFDHGTGTDDLHDRKGYNDGTLTDMDPGSDWVTSGAAIGDVSAHDYVTQTPSLAHADGDELSISNVTGTPDGVHVYLINDPPNNTAPPAGYSSLETSRYWGVKVIGGTSPTYTATYSYAGNANIDGNPDEEKIALVYRDDNADATWAKGSSVMGTNTSAKTITSGIMSGTEFVPGFKDVLYPTPPGSGDALEYKNVNSKVAVGQNAELNALAQFTLEAWVFPETWGPAANMVIFDKYQGLTPGWYGYIDEGAGGEGNFVFTAVTTDGLWSTAQTVDGAIKLGKWQHIAITVQADRSVHIYINGEETAYQINNVAASGVFSGCTQNLNFGNREASTTPLDGKLDEIRIWKDILSVAQLRDWMCKKVTTDHPKFADLVSYYRFDDGTGSTIVEDIKGISDGTLTNIDENNDWVTSGVALGDESAHDYIALTPTLTDAEGDDVAIADVTGSPDGVHIYRVDEAPNALGVPVTMGSLSDNRYWGVFIANGTAPDYTFTYNYDGNSWITDETQLELAKRDNNATASWTDGDATIDTAANTLTITNLNTEVLLGTKLAQTITFDPLAAVTYGDADFDPGATATSGLGVEYSSSDGTVATIVLGQIHIVGAGSCTIYADQSGDATYGPAPQQSQTLTVNKASLTVTCDDKTRAYKTANPTLTMTYAGFVLGDDEDDLDTKPTATTTAILSSPEGDYPITAAGGVSANYAFTYVDGNFKVSYEFNAVNSDGGDDF